MNASNTNKQAYISPMRNCGGRCRLKAGSVASGTPCQQPGVREYSGAEPDAQVAEEDQVRESSLPHLAGRYLGASWSWLGRSQYAVPVQIGQRGAAASEHGKGADGWCTIRGEELG